MVPYLGWIHLEKDLKRRFRHIELKANCRRGVRVASGKPLGPAMIGSGPEFSRPVPRGGSLLIDTVLKKVVCAVQVGPVVEANQPA
jgi:hypothetical protein